MRLGALNRVPVVSLEEGRKLGYITGALMDFKQKLAAYLVVDTGVWYKGPFCVPFSSISGIDGAVMVLKSATVVPVTEAPEALELAEGRCFNYAVFTLQGKQLGKAVDYDIDICGRVTEIILEDENTVPSSLIRTVGDGLIILATEAENPGAELMADAGRKKAEEAEKIPNIDKNYFSDIGSLNKATELAAEQKSDKQNSALDTETEKEIPSTVEIEPPLEIQKTETKKPVKSGGSAPTPHPRTLIGRRLTRDLRAGDGTLIAKNNDIVTASLLELARTLGRLVELSECSREMG